MSQQKRPNLGTPDKAKAVGYFFHFPSNFLRPYGLAAPAPDANTIHRRANHTSCEWLLRPGVAMSEFAETVSENMNFLKETDMPLVNRKRTKSAIEAMEPFLNALNRLNNKSSERPNHADIVTVLSYLYDDDSDVSTMMRQMFRVGGAMYATAIHFLVAQEILGDPSSYADRLIDDCPVGHQFKRQRNLQSLKEMLISACVQNPNSQSSSSTPQRSSVRKNLLVELKDLENKPSTSKSVFPKSSKRKHEEMSHEWSSEDEAPILPKRKEVNDDDALDALAESYRGKGTGKGKKNSRKE